MVGVATPTRHDGLLYIRRRVSKFSRQVFIDPCKELKIFSKSSLQKTAAKFFVSPQEFLIHNLMTFREFYYYTEAVQLLRSFWPEHDITNLGVYGWWDVYYVNKVPRVSDAPAFNNNRIKTPNDLRFFRQSPMYQGHREAQEKASLICPEAAQALASLGFPRQRSVLVLMEGSIAGKNPITGGEGDIGGEAYKAKHGIRIPLQHFGMYILLHEHAHMQWFNMSKGGKKIFIDWYEQQAKAGAAHPAYYSKFTPQLKNWYSYHINANFRNYVRYIAADTLDRLSERRGSTPKLYFDAHSALKEGHTEYALKEVLFQRAEEQQPARLKQSYTFEDIGGRKHLVRRGEVVHVWKLKDSYLFMMSWANEEGTMHSLPMESWDMWQAVEFDIELLEPEEQKKVRSQLEWCKKTLQGYFAPKGDMAAFGKDLHAAVMKLWPKMEPPEDEHDDKIDLNPLPAFPVEDIHGAFAAALKRKKFADFTGYDGWSDLIELLQGVLQEKFHLNNIGFKDENQSRKFQASSTVKSLGTPEGSGLRNFLATKGFPSSYGAANVDELWAETVAKAASNLRSIDPGLRKLLIQAITLR